MYQSSNHLINIKNCFWPDLIDIFPKVFNSWKVFKLRQTDLEALHYTEPSDRQSPQELLRLRWLFLAYGKDVLLDLLEKIHILAFMLLRFCDNVRTGCCLREELLEPKCLSNHESVCVTGFLDLKLDKISPKNNVSMYKEVRNPVISDLYACSPYHVLLSSLRLLRKSLSSAPRITNLCSCPLLLHILFTLSHAPPPAPVIPASSLLHLFPCFLGYFSLPPTLLLLPFFKCPSRP